MKKEANFDEVLFSLGQEVIQVLIRRGASLEDAQDAVSQTYTTIFSLNKKCSCLSRSIFVFAYLSFSND